MKIKGKKRVLSVTQAELTARERAGILKALSREAGFLDCRIARAAFLEEEAPKLEAWLSAGKHGRMSYMENHFDLRLDPGRLVPGARSVVTLAYNYFPEEPAGHPDGPKVSKYAYGEDYHRIIRRKLKEILSRIRESIGPAEGRVFVDSAPVMEKAWATRNGTGWTGRHTNVVHPSRGSFFFLAELILDLDLEPDAPIADHCGTCTRCVDACPTDALATPYSLDASRCISYLTIELREAIPPSFAGKMENWVFGCDICQDVCPWNHKFSVVHREPAFQPGVWKDWTSGDWKEMTEEVFEEVFGRSALRRAGYTGVSRNIRFLESRNGQPDA